MLKDINANRLKTGDDIIKAALKAVMGGLMVDDQPLSNKAVVFEGTQDKLFKDQFKNDKYVLIDPVQNMLIETRHKLFDSNPVFSKDIGISTNDLDGKDKLSTERKIAHYLARSAYEAVFTP